MGDLVDTMAEAICKASYNGTNVWAVKGLRNHYRKLAKAALEAIHKDNSWYGAPGDTHECPVCDMDWRAVDAGPLDIAWIPSP